MSIKLEDGKRYVRFDGTVVDIAGPTKNYPEWVWSIGADWYDRATGRFVTYTKARGHYLMPEGNWRNIEKLAEGDV